MIVGQRCGTCKFLNARDKGHYECIWTAPIPLPISLWRHQVQPNSGGKCPVYVPREPS